MASPSSALNINWSFGFSKDIIGGVQSLASDDRNAFFFVSSHSGVIYNYEKRSQMILQGHCNFITCCAVSSDKRWIVTGDTGLDSILVVWDSKTGTPVKTFFNPHPYGVTAVDISSDSLYVVSVGSSIEGSSQDIAIWAWTNDEENAILRKEIHSADPQHTIKFDSRNQTSMVSTGNTSVFFWSWKEFSLEGFSARASRSEFGFFSGNFTCTLFLAGTSNSLTSTSDGYVIFWESQSESKAKGGAVGPIRAASKVLRLVETGINTMTTTSNNYLAIACADGAVRFYDYFLRLEAWFEDLSAGPITSISLAVMKNPYGEGEAGAPGLRFWVPDFITATADALVIGVESSVFDEIRPEDRRGTLLLQGIAEEVTAVACHPYKQLVAMTCRNGTMQLWDYDLKLLMIMREFNDATAKLPKSVTDSKAFFRPQSVCFSPHADTIAVGFSTGMVKFLTGDTCEDIATFHPSTEGISGIKFSSSGMYMSCYDKSNHVILFKRGPPGQATAEGAYGEYQLNGEFRYIGRIKAHTIGISGLEFGFRESSDVLVSVGLDRRVVEYDLDASTVAAGVQVVTNEGAAVRVSQTARPTAIMWHPHLEDDVEDRFIVATTEYKFNELNVDSKQCRKTTLAPTFGAPPNKLVHIGRGDVMVTHFAYSTPDKVIGIGCLPLSGNPNKVMGMVAHPAVISDIAVSFDGKYLFSAGGADLSVNMWAIDIKVMPFHDLKDPNDLTSFYTLLEGGEDGELHNDIVDYFFYGQLRAQGEDCMDMRNMSGRVPLDEIPALMRAVGFYPTELEALNMINEVRYKTFMNTGVTVDDIGLVDFIKLYINHRPAIPLSSSSIATAFATLSQSAGGDGSSMTWAALKKVLMSEGEVLSQAELDSYMAALLGSHAVIADGVTLNSSLVAGEILGFESGAGDT